MMRLEDKGIRIIEMLSGKVTEILPKAVESCMSPGTFLITPIEVSEDEQSIVYRVENEKICIPKEKVVNGDISIEEIIFQPLKKQGKLSCNPCRNCGRC